MIVRNTIRIQVDNLVFKKNFDLDKIVSIKGSFKLIGISKSGKNVFIKCNRNKKRRLAGTLKFISGECCKCLTTLKS